MSDLEKNNMTIDENIKKQLQKAYIDGFKDGISHSCDFYSIALREMHLKVHEKLANSVDVIFKQD